MGNRLSFRCLMVLIATQARPELGEGAMTRQPPSTCTVLNPSVIRNFPTPPHFDG